MEKQEYEEISLANIGGGASSELFKRELDSVLENIADVNTAAKGVRKITLEFTIKPTENRDMGEVSVSCHSKLARVKPAAATMYLVKKGHQTKAYHHNINQTEMNLNNVVSMEERDT